MSFTRERIEEINDSFFKTASAIIETGQEHRPMVFAFPDEDTKAGPIMVDVSPLMENERGKDLVGELLKKLAADYGLVMMVAEGWAVFLDATTQGAADLYNAGVRPSQHPNRVEVLTVSYTIKDAAPAFVHHRIVASEGKRTLQRGELVFDAEAEGRFVPNPTPKTRH